jgi:NADH-quinone oxidoreductase subunit H
MRFGLFFLAEYTHMAVGAAMFATMFLGGWSLLPFVDVPLLRPEDTGLLAALAKFAVLFGKAVLLVCFMIVIRWTLPRLRFDQVMQVAWNVVIPLSILTVVMNAVMIFYGYTSLPAMLAANVALFVVLLVVQPLLPRSTGNRKIRLAGSRFSPLEDEDVVTAAPAGVAREDRPVEGTARLGVQ